MPKSSKKSRKKNKKLDSKVAKSPKSKIDGQVAKSPPNSDECFQIRFDYYKHKKCEIHRLDKKQGKDLIQKFKLVTNE